MQSAYQRISTNYKQKFFNFFLNQFLNKLGGYNLQHDQMVYKLSNFGAKVKTTYISFSFGTREEDTFLLLDMLQNYGIFDIKQVELNITQITFQFTPQKIKKLKHLKSKSQSQGRLKQLILNCYRRMRDLD